MSDRGPRSEWARYAYGYSDKKPGRGFWLMNAAMVAFIVLFSLSGCSEVTERRGAATQPPSRYNVTPDPIPMHERYLLVVDEDTGCQYWRSRGADHSTVPRYKWGAGGLTVKGCRP